MSSGLKTEKENQNSLDQVILGIAHELNNPNAFIRLNATNLKKMFWMLKPCLDEYQKNHPDARFGPYSLPELKGKISQQVESILDATVRVIVIADKLKNCSTDILQKSSSLSLTEIINNILNAHQFLLERLARVDFDYEEDSECCIGGYRLQLEQVFSALLTNACDAISERYGEEQDEKGEIEISVSREDDSLVVSIRDNGCGMSRKTIEKAFVPYFTTKPHGMGDGLGLALCRSIINRHGGKISIASELDKGTEITIKFTEKKG